MQPMTRMSRKELVEMIETTEAAGNDATELRNFLAQLPDEGQPPRRGGRRLAREEEESLRDRLNREVGDLFDGGITDEIEARCMAMDRDHSIQELQEMCKRAGISPNGHKKKLAAKLIAHHVDTEGKSQEQGVYEVSTRFELSHTVRASSKKEAEDIAREKGEAGADTKQLQDWLARRIG